MMKALKSKLLRGVMTVCVTGALAACSGQGTGTTPAQSTLPSGLGFIGPFIAPQLRNLTVADIERIIAQAVEEALARNVSAVIAVTDRVGNVLAVFQMNGATLSVRTEPGPNVSATQLTTALLNQFPPPAIDAGNVGAQGLFVPRTLAAIAKAVTGSYLSSAGNAFTTRTASMIVQEHFPPSPATIGLESGPLFGVQFSQLPCSDLNTRFVMGGGVTIGPKRSPLGLAADPGGIPLYKDGVVVGAIGVMADNEYSFDTNVDDVDTDVDELIAVAGTNGFAAPSNIRADKIFVDGTSLRFTDREAESLITNPDNARSFAAINGVDGTLVTVPGYFSPANIIAGEAFGSETSGIRQATAAEFTNTNIHVLSDGAGNNRFPPIAGTDNVTTPLTANEVRTLLNSAFDVLTRARAQIRQPLNSRAQVSVSVVDTNGTILGIVRSPDAPIFGIDVSLQKARTATFFSGLNAESDLENTADPNVNTVPDAVQAFVGPNALTDGTAFADRSGGNLSRPYFPDGEVGTANGPLSLPINQWSPFATGLQLNLVVGNIAQHIGFVYGGGVGTDTPARCTSLPDIAGVVPAQNRLQNGIQIFPGSVPIYRGNELIGGIGVSGDGIDQDDMISFLGLNNAGIATGTINNADPSIRADNIVITVNGQGIRLRYVNCPFQPFVDSDEQNVCQGL